MNRKFMNFAAVGIGILGLAGLNSCLKVDETYDLEKDFDMTITVGGDLSVPGSSTEKILLGDLLDLEEDGIIKVNESTGEYHLVQDGEKTSTTVNVPGVDIAMTDGFTGKTINQTIPTGNAGTTVGIQFNQKIDVNIEEDGITSDIKSLSAAETSCNETYIVFSATSTVAKAKLPKGYEIIFPEYVTVKSEDSNWKENNNKLILQNINGLEIKTNTKVKFQIIKIDFTKNGASFVENDNEKDNNAIKMTGNISLNGNIQAIKTSNQSGNITMTVDVESNNMSIVSVTGKVDPAVDINVDPITLEDIPEFLSDNNVILDLTDPQIFVTLTNPSPVAVEINGKLTSKKEGQNDKSVEIPKFEVPGNVENYVVCINQIKDGTEEGINYVKVNELSSIIENIPEKIEMDVDANAVQKDITINLAEDYTIETDYKIDTPLSFGPKTNITYTETIDGWDADLEDAEFKEVKVSMTAINEIPLGIRLKAEAIDVNGKPLDNVKLIMWEKEVEADETTLTPGNIGNPSNKDLSFSIVSEGSIKGLDGIKISIVGFVDENAGNASLNENQTMQFTNIKLTLKGGITMDLN